MVIILFFSDIEQAVLIALSIILSLWSVGNGTREYLVFRSKTSATNYSHPPWYYIAVAVFTATDMFNRSLTLAYIFNVAIDIDVLDSYVLFVIVTVFVHEVESYVFLCLVVCCTLL